MTALQVAEIFHSVQGEGYHTGKLATFVRLQGCTVGCEWCDTKYTWTKGGHKMTPEEIMIECRGIYHVVITGGEPTLYDLEPLAQMLKKEHYIQLETSGQNELRDGGLIDWITWSPKAKLQYKCALSLMRRVHEIKWVVDDLLTVEDVWSTYLQWRRHTVLMPEGNPPKKEMVDKAIGILSGIPCQDQSNFRFGDRLQCRLGVR